MTTEQIKADLAAAIARAEKAEADAESWKEHSKHLKIDRVFAIDREGRSDREVQRLKDVLLDSAIVSRRWRFEMHAANERAEKAEAERDEAVVALQVLYDEQNGPPLGRHAERWRSAMDAAEAVLAKAQDRDAAKFAGVICLD
jgi:hypothetical protein